MQIQLDCSDGECSVGVGLAPDGPGDRYLLMLNDLELTINYAQMQALYEQMRGWFVDEDEGK